MKGKNHYKLTCSDSQSPLSKDKAHMDAVMECYLLCRKEEEMRIHLYLPSFTKKIKTRKGGGMWG